MPKDRKDIKFKVGIDFENKNSANEAIQHYGLCQGKPVWVDKDDKKRLVVWCKEGCPFYLRISIDTNRQV